MPVAHDSLRAWVLCLLFAPLPAFAQSRDAEPATRAANDAFIESLPFSDRADFDDAKRGFIATLPDGVIAGPGGRPAFDTKPYAFLQKAPATVNPSKHIVVNWTFTDLNQSYAVNLENSALTHTSGKLASNADVGVTLTRATRDAITLKQRTFAGSIASGDVSISGNPLKLAELFGLLDEFSPGFEIVEPMKAAVE
jgi:alkyl sulfatase BDS1-like metallo-beta-lactamase superfamily hydrolase